MAKRQESVVVESIPGRPPPEQPQLRGEEEVLSRLMHYGGGGGRACLDRVEREGEEEEDKNAAKNGLAQVTRKHLGR